MIREECDSGWRDNYELYMAANASDQTITIYNYNSFWTFSSSLFLTDHIEDPRYIPLVNIYIPGNDLANISNCSMHNYFIFSLAFTHSSLELEVGSSNVGLVKLDNVMPKPYEKLQESPIS